MGVLHIYIPVLGNGPDNNSYLQTIPSSCQSHQLSRQLLEPGHPSSKGNAVLGEKAVPRSTTDLLGKAPSALCLNFPRSQLSGEPQG